MSDKVRPLSEGSPTKPFRLSVEAPRVRDQDNAQPRPQPPQAVAIPNPRLAPPGMSGSRSRFVPLVTGQDRTRGRDR